MQRFALFAVLTLGACAPSIDPGAKASLDGWSAAIQPKSASYGDSGIERQPPAVGQWTEYRDVDADGTVTRRIQKVVGEEDGAYWVEHEIEGYSGKTVMKALIAMQDWNRPETVEIRRIISQPEGQQAQEVPAFLAQTIARPITAALTADIVTGSVETVTVPAGRFEAYRMASDGLDLPLIGSTAATSWINLAVPISGAVKTEAANGLSSELIAFGDSGAASAITGKVAVLQ